jgi:putative ABC transport system permease protein
VGISSLSFFLALSAGVQRVARQVFPVDEMEVVPAQSSLEGPLAMLGGPKPITDEVWQTLKARPEVRAAYRRAKIAFPARAWGGQALLGRDVHAELIAEGMDPEATAGEPLGPEPFQLQPQDGRACNADAECAASSGIAEVCPWDTHQCERPVPAVVSPFLVEIYNGTLAPSHGLPKIGKFLVSRFRGFTFTIELGRSFLGPGLGLGKSGGEPHQRQVMLVGVARRASPLALTMPLEYVRAWNREYAGDAAARELSSILLLIKEGADVTRLAEAVKALGFKVADSGAERAGLAITLLTLLFTLVSFAIVSVAAVNIAHSFFQKVAERRREIGLYRAVGASRTDVAALFLAEAAVIGLLGGVAGVFVARIGALGVDAAARRFVPDFPFKPDSFFSFEGSAVVAAIVCAVIACLVGAAWPARAATRVEPAEALASG